MDSHTRVILVGSLALLAAGGVACDSPSLSYRMAGSLVLYLTERFGLPAVLEFLRGGSGRTESLAAVQARMRSVFGVSVEEAETGWLAMLAR